MISQKSFLFMLALLMLAGCLFAQDAVQPRESPLSIIRVRYKDAYMKLTYSQPHKRNREIFGKLVPYGQLWRLGANEATELTITKDILAKDQLLKAGTYSIFAIPDKENWTIIFNSEVGLWGAYNYNQKLDVMRFEVPVQKMKTIYEPLTMALDQKNELIDLVISWDDVRVTVPFKFTN